MFRQKQNKSTYDNQSHENEFAKATPPFPSGLCDNETQQREVLTFTSWAHRLSDCQLWCREMRLQELLMNHMQMWLVQIKQVQIQLVQIRLVQIRLVQIQLVQIQLVQIQLVQIQLLQIQQVQIQPVQIDNKYRQEILIDYFNCDNLEDFYADRIQLTSFSPPI